jgi:hypothetical protein
MISEFVFKPRPAAGVELSRFDCAVIEAADIRP